MPALPSLVAQEPPASAPQEPEEEVVITATAFPEDPLDLPFSVDWVDLETLRWRARTLPEALQGQPSVQVQKTAYGQSSPFIRGFTGYRTLMLVDGVRLNHAAMRSGPNQYWSTVDALSVERVELVRGPSSVLYGSDAIGGTVNAISRSTPRGAEGSGAVWSGSLYGRYASAEDSWSGRAELGMTVDDDWALLAGVTVRDFNDLEGGADVGIQPSTGYEERNGDLRLDHWFSNGMQFTFNAETVRQIDVPRTHKTVDGISWSGTDVGSELLREQDQVRDLIFGRLQWEEGGGLFDTAEITLSWQRHSEQRDRLRTGGRRDIQGFELQDLGFTARFQTPGWGNWSWGVEGHRETVSSFRDNYVNGVLTSSEVQGPVGDDASYTTIAAYVQNEQEFEDWSLIPGLRFTRIDMSADSVANPASSGPARISVEDTWNSLVGSLRGVLYLSQESSLYGGLSQGFRAPSLSDMTSFDVTSAVEVPTTNLDPERFLQAEVGWKGQSGDWDWQASAYRTFIQDMIVQSPTGAFEAGVPVVEKSNIGDGWIHGVELDLAWQWHADWRSAVTFTWMDGEVQQFDSATTSVVDAPVSRLMPPQGMLTTRYEPEGMAHWVEGWVWAVDNQDNLALRDELDTQRIPPGGTPGYTVFGITAGWEIAEDQRLTVGVENLFDRDYRVHGSGVNGPGRNVVVTYEVLF